MEASRIKRLIWIWIQLLALTAFVTWIGYKFRSASEAEPKADVFIDSCTSDGRSLHAMGILSAKYEGQYVVAVTFTSAGKVVGHAEGNTTAGSFGLPAGRWSVSAPATGVTSVRCSATARPSK